MNETSVSRKVEGPEKIRTKCQKEKGGGNLIHVCPPEPQLIVATTPVGGDVEFRVGAIPFSGRTWGKENAKVRITKELLRAEGWTYSTTWTCRKKTATCQEKNIE